MNEFLKLIIFLKSDFLLNKIKINKIKGFDKDVYRQSVFRIL